jgi:hypothetical protein
MSRNSDEAGCFVQVIGWSFVILVILFIQLVSANSGRMVIEAKVLDTFVKVSSGSTTYIASLSVDGNVEPFEIENNPFIGRWDKTTVYSQIEQLKGKCISADVYGFRIPSLGFRGLTSFKESKCEAAE